MCAKSVRNWRTAGSSCASSTIAAWRGRGVCARYTSLVDAAIGRLYDAYLAELPAADAQQLRERVALVAHGGYGRRQQAPFSDVDLMILYEGKRDAPIAQLASRLTQDICDVYQHLGHSLRTPGRGGAAGRATDAQIGTSLLESRLLLGSYRGVSPAIAS